MWNTKIVVRNTENLGKGIFAQEDLQKDEILFEFEGPILYWDESLPWDADGWTDDLHDHAVQIGETSWIANVGKGRYMNHSCDPNCGIKNTVQVVAMRDIKAGEELSYDYEMTEDSVVCGAWSVPAAANSVEKSQAPTGTCLKR